MAYSRKGSLIAPSISLYHKAMLQIFPNRAADPSRASILNTAVANAASYWTGEHADCWDLYVCGVHPDYQGKGIGRALLSEAVRYAAGEFTVLVLNTQVNNNRSQTLYRGFGFRPIGMALSVLGMTVA